MDENSRTRAAFGSWAINNGILTVKIYDFKVNLNGYYECPYDSCDNDIYSISNTLNAIIKYEKPIIMNIPVGKENNYMNPYDNKFLFKERLFGGTKMWKWSNNPMYKIENDYISKEYFQLTQ